MSTIEKKTVEPVQLASGAEVRFVKAAGTELDDQGRICGSLDLPLSESGQATAADVVLGFEDQPIASIFTASCLAAQQTAKAIAKSHGIRVRVEETWQNLNHGLWHGKCLGEIKETVPKFYRQWRDSPETIAPPEGETFSDVRKRCLASVKKIKKKKHQTGKLILVVAPQPLLQILHDLFCE
ncbi:MAG: histidine phosphatase family protein [Planctomycetota bacterium]